MSSGEMTVAFADRAAGLADLGASVAGPQGAALVLVAAAPLALLGGGAALRSVPAMAGGALAGLVGLWVAIAIGAIPTPPAAMMALLKASVGAGALAFATTALPSIRGNLALGALTAGAALAMFGVGVLNIALGGQAAALIDVGLIASVGGALALSAYALSRGDPGGAFVAPGLVAGAIGLAGIGAGGVFTSAGAVLAVAAVAAATLGASAREMVARRGLVLATGRERDGAADIATLAARLADDSGAAHRGEGVAKAAADSSTLTAADAMRGAGAGVDGAYDAQLAEALDYVGVAVWDWSAQTARQTSKFGPIMGAEGEGVFTPDALRAFIREADLAGFERDVFGKGGEDGGFDWRGELVSGEKVRMRGARAVAAEGGLERIVMFLEHVEKVASPVTAETAVADEKPAKKLSLGLARSARAGTGEAEAVADGKRDVRVSDAAQADKPADSLLSAAAASLAAVATSASRATPPVASLAVTDAGEEKTSGKVQSASSREKDKGLFAKRSASGDAETTKAAENVADLKSTTEKADKAGARKLFAERGRERPIGVEAKASAGRSAFANPFLRKRMPAAEPAPAEVAVASVLVAAPATEAVTSLPAVAELKAKPDETAPTARSFVTRRRARSYL